MVRRLKTTSEADGISLYRRASKLWVEQSGELEADEDLLALQDVTRQRSNIIRFDPHNGFVIVNAGAGLCTGFLKWISSKPSASLSEFPDTNYARHLHAVYSEAIAKHCPIADEFDGLIKVPGHARKRYSYHRLILPFRYGDVDFLVTSTIMDNTLELLP